MLAVEDLLGFDGILSIASGDTNPPSGRRIGRLHARGLTAEVWRERSDSSESFDIVWTEREIRYAIGYTTVFDRARSSDTRRVESLFSQIAFADPERAS